MTYPLRRFATIAVFLAAEVLTDAAASAQSTSGETVLTITPTVQYALGADEINTVNRVAVVSGGTGVAIDLVHYFDKRLLLDLNYNPVAADNTAGRTYNAAGKIIESSLNRDYQTTATLSYRIQRQIALQGGYYYHARACCPAAGDPANPAPSAARVAFLQVDLSTMPLTKLGAVFTYAVRENVAFHRPNAAFLSSKSFSDSNRTEAGIEQTISGFLPIAPRGTLTAFGSLTWGPQDYYDGAPFAYTYDTVSIGFRSDVARNLTFQAVDNVRTQRLQGYPNVLPQAIHRSVLIMSLSYRIPLNRH